MSSAEDSQSAQVVRRLFAEVLGGARNLDRLDELLAPDYLDHCPGPGLPGDRTGVRPKLEGLLAAFPDAVFHLDALVAEGPLVAARSHWEGTHRGFLAGIAPTGRRVYVRMMDFYRIAGSRIAEHWDLADESGLSAQLEAR